MSYCPRCGTRGNPTSVSFNVSTRITSFKCVDADCGAEWIVQMPAAPADAKTSD
jgi:hypothetical protein